MYTLPKICMWVARLLHIDCMCVELVIFLKIIFKYSIHILGLSLIHCVFSHINYMYITMYNDKNLHQVYHQFIVFFFHNFSINYMYIKIYNDYCIYACKLKEMDIFNFRKNYYLSIYQLRSNLKWLKCGFNLNVNLSIILYRNI